MSLLEKAAEARAIYEASQKDKNVFVSSEKELVDFDNTVTHSINIE